MEAGEEMNTGKVTETYIYYDDGSLSSRIVSEYNRLGNPIRITQHNSDDTVVCTEAREIKEYCTSLGILPHRSDRSGDR